MSAGIVPAGKTSATRLSGEAFPIRVNSLADGIAQAYFICNERKRLTD